MTQLLQSLGRALAPRAPRRARRARPTFIFQGLENNHTRSYATQGDCSFSSLAVKAHRFLAGFSESTMFRRKNSTIGISMMAVICVVPLNNFSANAAEVTQTNATAMANAPKKSCPAQFIMAMANDAAGNVWLGTEDRGLFRVNPATGKWKQFKAKDGVADDNVYAVAVDKLGRVWCGTLNHGVSVFNGKQWKNFGIEDGPFGERVFDIQCSPTDGDVWMATSAGLARYRLASDTWSYVTRLDGLPSDQVQSLAFNKYGDLFAGLQCGGVAIARAQDFHRTWTLCAAPWYFNEGQTAPYPLTPRGVGLPSNLINDVLVARDGTVWVATVAGLTWSRDDGKTWQFLRGRNYVDRVKGFFGGLPKDWKVPSKDVLANLMPEDYVTCLAEAADGLLWLGFREKGMVALDPKTLEIRQQIKGGKNEALPDGYINRLLPLADGRILVGGYGSGVQLITPTSATNISSVSISHPPSTISHAPSAIPPLPKTAAPPTEEILQKWIAYLQILKTPMPTPSAVYLGEDWTTQGDWVERYGHRYAMLCAMNSPWDNNVIPLDNDYHVAGVLGPHYKPPDGLRHWVHWIKADNNLRVLYTPVTAMRRQAEWDDHGESYPRSFDGPDVWSVVDAPQGAHKISLYFYNKDGESGNNRLRDYAIEIRHYASKLPDKVLFGLRFPNEYGLPPDCRSKELALVQQQPILARARVKDFRGGVYKSFAVQGSGPFYVRIARNGSHNAIVSAVLVDKLPEPEGDATRDRHAEGRLGVAYTPPPVSLRSVTNQTTLAAAWQLWQACETAENKQTGVAAQRVARCLAYRAAADRRASSLLLANWRWSLHLWNDAERQRFWSTMMLAWDKSQERSLALRSAQFRPYSPHVVPFSVEELCEMERQGINWRTFIPK